MIKLFLVFFFITQNSGLINKFQEEQPIVPRGELSFSFSSRGYFTSLATYRFELSKNLNLRLGLLNISQFSGSSQFPLSGQYGLINLNYHYTVGKHLSLSFNFYTTIPLNINSGIRNSRNFFQKNP